MYHNVDVPLSTHQREAIGLNGLVVWAGISYQKLKFTKNEFESHNVNTFLANNKLEMCIKPMVFHVC